MKNKLPMAVTHPDLAAELDVSKGWNPNKLVSWTGKKIDWICRKCTYGWSSLGGGRVSLKGCPVCAGKVVHPDGRNSMAVTHPKIAAELDTARGLDPNKITAGTSKKLDWICTACDYRWSAPGCNRSGLGRGCPACANQALHPDGRNSMAVTHPKLAAELDTSKGWNPLHLFAGTQKEIDWICKECSYCWASTGGNRVVGNGCPACANKCVHSDGRNSMAVTHPKLAAELDTSKGLDPTKIIAGTQNKLDWICKKCAHRWSAMGSSRAGSFRAEGRGCPACSNRCLHLDGRNSMARTHPDLIAELDTTKGWDPATFVAGTGKKLDWICRECAYAWTATGASRVGGSRQSRGCPSCVNQRLHPDGRNSMAVTHPKLAAELDTSKGLDPTKIFAGTGIKIGWVCKKCAHRWSAVGSSRAMGRGCPVCANKYLHSDGRNSMARTHPDLDAELDKVKGWDSTKLVAGTGAKLDWICSTCGHSWSAAGSLRAKGGSCPKCVMSGYSASEHIFDTYIESSILQIIDQYPSLRVDIDPNSRRVPNKLGDGQSFQIDAKVFWEDALILAFFYDGAGYHADAASRTRDRRRRSALCRGYPEARVLALRRDIPSLDVPCSNYTDVSTDRNDSILFGVSRLLESAGLPVPQDVDAILTEAERTWKLLPKANPWKIISVVKRERKLITLQHSSLEQPPLHAVSAGRCPVVPFVALVSTAAPP